MARVFDSKTGAGVFIVSNDHCPPHLHARHREEGWIVRLRFCFASDAVGVISIAPTERAVRHWQLDRMMDETAMNIEVCRGMWWDGKQTTCLENRWMMAGATGKLVLLDERHKSARQVVSAAYHDSTRTTMVILSDGTQHHISRGEA